MFILYFVIAAIITTVCVHNGIDAQVFHPIKEHFVQRAVIAHVELCGILFGMRRAGVTADAGARAAADLRNADFQHLLARALRFAGRDNHARIRDGDADHGDDLAEYFVRNGIRDIFIILVPPFGFIIYYDVTLKSIGKLKIITDVW